MFFIVYAILIVLITIMVGLSNISNERKDKIFDFIILLSKCIIAFAGIKLLFI